ncbi:monofunctional biosynthetic peptidoglycan transglycosylase [Pustulibacterium marinum]|uniref:Biosynthetic peptidoglycan transglycosylase n=1 Tax=Pustulibacterium marinum TaxID=1224947 RepID=A0A1I7EUK8_9FLAO|nr:monofunctional biosynthetic peptidoglycan transglycosylase [Pustulibacterium marinum]SFU27592.1 monofunctional biosynthetic peptidoglycan transglycosylase [Pustulibacterium marinum]
MKKLFKFLFKIILWFVAITVIWVVLLRFVPVFYTPLMLIRAYENREDTGWELKHDWVPRKYISPNMELAVVCSEDQNFVTHNGFDFGAIEKAMKFNENHKTKKRGASTISQQTAKNVFLWPGRSWVRKGFEVYFTFLIELIWPKERIMEVYLNSIEMGNGIFGVEEASKYWFTKPASKLSKANAAALAAVLPNPRKYRANPPTPYIQKRIAWTLQQMRFHGGKLDYTKKKKDETSKK